MKRPTVSIFTFGRGALYTLSRQQRHLFGWLAAHNRALVENMRRERHLDGFMYLVDLENSGFP